MKILNQICCWLQLTSIGLLLFQNSADAYSGGDITKSIRISTLQSSTVLKDNMVKLQESSEANNGKELPSTSFGATFQLRMQDSFKALLAVPIAPTGIAFLVGYQIGSRSIKNAMSATNPALQTTSAQGRPWQTWTLLLITFGIKEIWFAIPSWLKRNLPWIRRPRKRVIGARGNAIEESTEKDSKTKSDDHDHNHNDLTSIFAVTAKMQSLFNLASSKLRSASQDDNGNIPLAFFVLLQLMSQIKANRAEIRDEAYQEDGTPMTDFTEFQSLQEYFEFADWAYDELPEESSLKDALNNAGFRLLRHDKTDLPGFVSHYVAWNPERNLVVIAIKGTSSLGDILTDCCGLAVSHELDYPFEDGANSTIRCHEGILLSSKRLCLDLEPLLNDLILPTRFNILVTGHSLGAGVASLVGLLLRSRLAMLREEPSRLRVVAFASPPILDCDSALACKSFVTTVVNNADIIPRASISNLLVLMEFLKRIDRELELKGKRPKDFVSTSQFLIELSRNDTEMIVSIDEIKDGLYEAFKKVELRDPDHLYVPGRVIHLYDLWTKESNSKSLTQDENSPPVTLKTAEKAQITDGTSFALRAIELDSRFLDDHLCPGYRSSIRSFLISEKENET
jgi:Lipase (class 3)